MFRIILGLGGLIMLFTPLWPLGIVMLLFALLLSLRASGRKQVRELRRIRRRDS